MLYDENVELPSIPLFPNDRKKSGVEELTNEGIITVPRSISVNIFYTSNEIENGELMKKEDASTFNSSETENLGVYYC